MLRAQNSLFRGQGKLKLSAPHLQAGLPVGSVCLQRRSGSVGLHIRRICWTTGLVGTEYVPGIDRQLQFHGLEEAVPLAFMEEERPGPPQDSVPLANNKLQQLPIRAGCPMTKQWGTVTPH
jgi:hypothetical protein